MDGMIFDTDLGGTQVCGLSTIYCCYTVNNQPVDSNIPDSWPPVATPVPAALRQANLNCASGNCTEEAVPPVHPPPEAPGPLAPGPMHSATTPFTAPGPSMELPIYAQAGISAPPAVGPTAAPPVAAALAPQILQSAAGSTQTSSASLSGGAIGGIAGDCSFCLQDAWNMNTQSYSQQALLGSFIIVIYLPSLFLTMCSNLFYSKVCAMSWHAAGGAAAAIAFVCAAVFGSLWRRRRRKLGSLDSKSSPRGGGHSPGSPVDGLPIHMQEVYKQGSADSQEPFLGARDRMISLLPWRRSLQVHHKPLHFWVEFLYVQNICRNLGV